MAVVIRLERDRKRRNHAKGLAICKYPKVNDIEYIKPSPPVIAKFAYTSEDPKHEIARFLPEALGTHEVRNRLKLSAYRDVLFRVCNEARKGPACWRYKVLSKTGVLDMLGLKEFKKITKRKPVLLVNVKDMVDIPRERLNLVNCAWDVYYVKTGSISANDDISIHPVFQHEMILDTYEQHRWINPYTYDDLDYRKAYSTIDIAYENPIRFTEMRTWE